jgi:DNA-binding transcriptional regulator YiaG
VLIAQKLGALTMVSIKAIRERFSLDVSQHRRDCLKAQDYHGSHSECCWIDSRKMHHALLDLRYLQGGTHLHGLQLAGHLLSTDRGCSDPGTKSLCSRACQTSPGRSVSDSHLARRGHEHFANTRHTSPIVHLSPLTPEEIVTRRVLKGRGQSNRQIARTLQVSEGSVRYHLSRQGKPDGRHNKPRKAEAVAVRFVIPIEAQNHGSASLNPDQPARR